ncbi:GspB family T2SS assembly factor variant ExeB [Aeromonas allosaccharophila]|uniref:GspB family T2SS assembly factor variant ExeB n=1 Tax=Aeromonas allosaccharophila TaxID=656 RepID=A0AAX3NUY0_9GAMM|nr:GspB family T2SS assembly factor variant ExeB [Aeromonas allosaccharophila]WED77944.1 GspB family T2SS assembly factor variant ExeB [Aeromonas allosaccharophila]
MSTLLKALHRAQQPQQSAHIPAMGLPMPREEARTSRRISWLLAPLALLLGAGANYGWHLIHLRPIEEKVEVKEVITPPFVRVEPRAMVTRPLPPPLPEPVVQPRAVAKNEAASQGNPPTLSLAEQLMKALNETPLQETPHAASQNNVQPAQLMALGSAPQSVRQQVPQLSYGSHVFSTDPAKRAVVLNGREYREGSEIAPGVVLATIDQQYIVLQVTGQSVTLKALQDWRG